MIKQLIQIFDICDVCFWQYDETSHDKPDAVSGANGITLNVAIKNYRKRYYMREYGYVNQYKHDVFGNRVTYIKPDNTNIRYT